MFAKALCFPLLLLILSPLSCFRKSTPVHVHNPHGFKGEADIACTSYADKAVAIELDADGRAIAPTCPSSESAVFIDEDGTFAKVDTIQWIKTGDGIVVGMKLKVP
jgi:hypothetical protein